MIRVKQAGQHFLMLWGISVNRQIYKCISFLRIGVILLNLRSSFEMASFESLLSVVHFFGRCLSLLFTLPLVVVHVGMGHMFLPVIELDTTLPTKNEKKHV